MSKNFVPHFSGLQIDWGDSEEIEFLGQEVLDGRSAMTAAQCRYGRTKIAYNYPVNTARNKAQLILTYTRSPQSWPKHKGWSVIQGTLTITFSSTHVGQPEQVVWDRKDSGTRHILKEGEDWIYQPSQDLQHAPIAARGRLLRSVLERPQQSLLRAQLLASGSVCEVSQTGCSAAIEACHILPVKNGGKDWLENAILLRRDIHALFDANLLRFEVHSGSWLVSVDDAVKDTVYRAFDGLELRGAHLLTKQLFLAARNSLAQ